MALLTLLPPSWMASLVHDGFELDEVECHICEADLNVSVSGNTLADLRRPGLLSASFPLGCMVSFLPSGVQYILG